MQTFEENEIHFELAPVQKNVHSSSTPQFLGTILTDFLPGFFFFIYNLMLFIKKKRIFGNVSIRETQKISAKNTQ